MRAFTSRRCLPSAFRLALIAACALLCASTAFAQSQSNAADLRGFVRDQRSLPFDFFAQNHCLRLLGNSSLDSFRRPAGAQSARSTGSAIPTSTSRGPV